MENLQQYALNKRFAEDTANRIEPSAEGFRNGIEFKSEARSNTLNGSFYLLTQAIQYLQFTGGLYDNNASYNEGNIVSCVVKDVDKYRLWKFRRNSNNASTLTGNAPITGGSVESANGVDVYILGSVSDDWDKLEDFNYSIEATPNYMIQRDNEGSAKVEMPSVIDDKSIINKGYLKAENVSYIDNKGLDATDVQTAIDNVVEKVVRVGAEDVKYNNAISKLQSTNVQSAIDELQSNMNIIRDNQEHFAGYYFDGKPVYYRAFNQIYMINTVIATIQEWQLDNMIYVYYMTPENSNNIASMTGFNERTTGTDCAILLLYTNGNIRINGGGRFIGVSNLIVHYTKTTDSRIL